MSHAAAVPPVAARIPPHDLEAEASVLGAILLSPAAVGEVLDILAPEHFYRENNGQIYRAQLNLFREGEPIDNVTLAAELQKAGVLERVGGRAHLALLQESVPTAANVLHYAQIVRAKADKRALIAASVEGQRLGYDDALDADEAINLAQAAVYALSADKVGTGLVQAGTLVKPAMDRMEALMAAGGGVEGLPAGWTDLDCVTGGFKASDLVVLAARPSMGKSAMAFQIAAHVAIDLGRPVAIFSMEMSKEQVLNRLLCMRAQVDSDRAQKGRLNEREHEALIGAAGPLEAAPLFIDDSPSLTDLTFRLKARQARAREGVELILVDYLQLMETRIGVQGGDVNRVQQVSAIARALKAVARELSIPVIALSQLSRACDARPDKRPMLSDLRESGEIEACADLVLFLYRDEYYNRDKSQKPGIAEVNVAKHRNGPTGSVDLVFRRELTRFEDLDRRRAGEPAGAGANGRPHLVPTE
jgi:replicative DNA helicase